MHLRFPVLPLALLLAFSASASAQLSLDTRVSVLSAFVWRGLTVVNRPVVQPEVTLSAGPASIGLWANLEPVRYRGADDLTALAGRRAPGLTEVDPSIEVSRELGGVTVAGGAIGYAFTHAAGYETEPNTLELYGRMQLADALPLEVAGYYDVHTVRGLYLEAGLEHGLPGCPALLLGARAGASFGETAGPETAYYDRNGITHVELSAAVPFVVGPLRLTPETHLDFGVDGATRITSRTEAHRFKLWFGGSVAWPGRAE